MPSPVVALAQVSSAVAGVATATVPTSARTTALRREGSGAPGRSAGLTLHVIRMFLNWDGVRSVVYGLREVAPAATKADAAAALAAAD